MSKIFIRAGELLAVLLVVSFGVFAMVTLMPGDPAVAILGEGHPPSDYADLRQELGLNDPLLVRYWDWLSSAVTGDLGSSLVPPQSRSEEHTSELQSLMRISYAVFCLKKKNKNS